LNRFARTGAIFVGREAELAMLRQAFASVARGLPVASLVHGASGIGKSALAEHFAEELRGRALVLRGRCHARESLPYNAFDGVINALARHLKTLSRAETRELVPPSAAARLRVFPSLRDCMDLPPADRQAQLLNEDQLREQAFAVLEHALTEHRSVELGLRTLFASSLVSSAVHGEWVVYHDRLREQIAQRMLETEAVALHRSLAEAYERAHDAEPESSPGRRIARPLSEVYALSAPPQAGSSGSSAWPRVWARRTPRPLWR
jgi:hypothetical protein